METEVLFLCFLLWIPLFFVKLLIPENKIFFVVVTIAANGQLVNYMLSTALNPSDTLLHLIITLRL